MISMDELHEQAMDLSDRAFITERRGELEAAIDLYKQAFQLEAKAADLVENDYSAEPTRSVLYRSAASMAIDAGEPDEARRLIGKALSGNPPKEIELELLELLDAIRRPHQQPKEFTGRLLFADARKGGGKIQLVAADGTQYTVNVPEGMIADIVKPLFDDVVTVKGIYRGKSIYLQDIRPA